MTKPSKLLLTTTILLLSLLLAIYAINKVTSRPSARTVTIAAPPTTRKSYPHAASARLGHLDLMRQGLLEANVPDDYRRRTLAVIDDTHKQLVAALDDESAGPTTRAARIDNIENDFNHAANGRLEDRELWRAMGDQVGFIWFELDLLSRRRLLPLMFEHLDLTPEQRKQADRAFLEVSSGVSGQPTGGLPNEISMQAMLSGRDKLHALLTPDQRTKLMQVLREQQQAKRQLRLSGSTTRSTNAENLRRLGQAILQTTQPSSAPAK